ncbi:rRNA biogenesis protein rrp5 [Acidaminococcus intestini]|uniref:rRNA biogenesis protein rrp5 n=1 Tax=Acidaminococcus intestini TaxID=187327 RepID=UPI0026597794|nr:rRNA biogenesis protein rrp5 [uncultured Dialister sp.]
MTKKTLVKLSAELETCGKALLKIAEALRSEEKAPAPESPKKEPVPRTLTLEEVRKVAADKSRQGFTEEVRNLIHHYRADKLSSLDPEKYDAFLKDLEVMGHAG